MRGRSLGCPIATTRVWGAACAVLLALAAWVLGEAFHDRPATAGAAVDAALGEKLYLHNCAACHGEKGDGKGAEAERLETKPRDFTAGKYKFRSTLTGSLPADEDIFRSISRGIRGTSMLAQLHLSDRERWAVAEYLKTLSRRFATEKPAPSIEIPAPPLFDSRLIKLGESRYTESGCNQCHGPKGAGDGASTRDLRDDWGEPISPTDLTLKPFKSGPAPEDLYRTLSTGLDGTPMPSYAAVLTPEERWAIVSYIVSIAVRERPRRMMGLVGEEMQGMRIDMRAAMAAMRGRGMMGRGGGMRNMMEEKMRR